MADKNPVTLAIGLSGGVDSSVALEMLCERRGMVAERFGPEREIRIVGVSHKIWPGSACCSEETLKRAEALCGTRSIPFVVLPMVEEFTRSVVDDFVHSYLSGETPNPCVRCNQRVRFDLFYKALETRFRKQGILAPEEPLYFSTGHYVRTKNIDGRWFLLRGLDKNKDQSYMLYRIPASLLPYLVFPLGELTKSCVVDIAKERNLPSSSVRESQDACFIDGEYTEFLRERMSSEGYDCERGFSPGPVKDTQGRLLGRHKGYIHYTVGQRRGLDLGDGPWYVQSVNPEENSVIVGRINEINSLSFTIRECRWFIPSPGEEISCTTAVRYNARDVPCSVTAGNVVTLSEPQVVTPGQSAVFYDGERLIGGGIIEKAFP